MCFRRARFTDAKEDDEAKGCSGQRVRHEEDEEVVIRDQSREKRRDRRAHVDCPVVISIGACPRFGWHEVRNRRADCRAVEIGKESDNECTNGNENEIMCQTQCDHKDRRDEETHQHHRAAAEAVCQFTAAQLRQERSRAEEGNHQRGCAHRDLPLGCEVQRQEGNDKTAETVDQRPGPDQPIRGRQALDEGSETLFIHVCFPLAMAKV